MLKNVLDKSSARRDEALQRELEYTYSNQLNYGLFTNTSGLKFSTTVVYLRMKMPPRKLFLVEYKKICVLFCWLTNCLYAFFYLSNSSNLGPVVRKPMDVNPN